MYSVISRIKRANFHVSTSTHLLYDSHCAIYNQGLENPSAQLTVKDSTGIQIRMDPADSDARVLPKAQLCLDTARNTRTQQEATWCPFSPIAVVLCRSHASPKAALLHPPHLTWITPPPSPDFPAKNASGSSSIFPSQSIITVSSSVHAGLAAWGGRRGKELSFLFAWERR